MQAMIEIESAAGYFKISDSLDDFGQEGAELDRSPSGMFSVEFTTIVVSGAFQVGGYTAGETIPVRRMTLPVHLFDVGDGIEDTVSRFRKLWGSPLNLLPVTWRYTSGLSGARWLTLVLEKEIQFSPERDWNIDGYAKAVVSVVALQPMYESAPLEVLTPTHPGGEVTYWLPAWNPTDQKVFPEWAFNPNGEASFAFPDFSFGNEQEIDPSWMPGDHDDRMIPVPADGGTIDVMWSVMSEPRMDTFVAADLSNAPGQMGGVDTLFWIPPYTGTPDEPILFPVTIDGPAGAQVRLTLRRFWSAESGLN